MALLLWIQTSHPGSRFLLRQLIDWTDILFGGGGGSRGDNMAQPLKHPFDKHIFFLPYYREEEGKMDYTACVAPRCASFSVSSACWDILQRSRSRRKHAELRRRNKSPIDTSRLEGKRDRTKVSAAEWQTVSQAVWQVAMWDINRLDFNNTGKHIGALIHTFTINVEFLKNNNRHWKIQKSFHWRWNIIIL